MYCFPLGKFPIFPYQMRIFNSIEKSIDLSPTKVKLLKHIGNVMFV